MASGTPDHPIKVLSRLRVRIKPARSSPPSGNYQPVSETVEAYFETSEGDQVVCSVGRSYVLRLGDGGFVAHAVNPEDAAHLAARLERDEISMLRRLDEARVAEAPDGDDEHGYISESRDVLVWGSKDSAFGMAPGLSLIAQGEDGGLSLIVIPFEDAVSRDLTIRSSEEVVQRLGADDPEGPVGTGSRPPRIRRRL